MDETVRRGPGQSIITLAVGETGGCVAHLPTVISQTVKVNDLAVRSRQSGPRSHRSRKTDSDNSLYSVAAPGVCSCWGTMGQHNF